MIIPSCKLSEHLALTINQLDSKERCTGCLHVETVAGELDEIRKRKINKIGFLAKRSFRLSSQRINKGLTHKHRAYLLTRLIKEREFRTVMFTWRPGTAGQQQQQHIKASPVGLLKPREFSKVLRTLVACGNNSS